MATAGCLHRHSHSFQLWKTLSRSTPLNRRTTAPYCVRLLRSVGKAETSLRVNLANSSAGLCLPQLLTGMRAHRSLRPYGSDILGHGRKLRLVKRTRRTYREVGRSPIYGSFPPWSIDIK